MGALAGTVWRAARAARATPSTTYVLESRRVLKLPAEALLAECSENVARDRGTTVEPLIRLGVIDERQLYLLLGCASMYAYCTQVMRMSENAATERPAAQRAGFAKRCIPRAVARAV